MPRFDPPSIGERALIGIGLVFAVAVPAGMAAAAPASVESQQLAWVEEARLSERLHEITLRTPAVVTKPLGPMPGNAEGLTKVRILLPKGYEPDGAQRYPVLYLFHGGGGNQTEWTTPATKGKADELTADLPLIVVMPDGGVASGYADWYNGGEFGPPRWKSYHLDQLIPWIDAHYRTIAGRGGRATAGLSMGGGGLRYAAQRPDLIGATAAFSGDVDILQPASDWNGMGAFVSRMIWGDRKSEEVRWRGVNGPDLAANLSNTDVSIFTGDTDKPEGTYIRQGSTALHDRLDALGIAHRFTLYQGMTHSWPNWNKALADWLPGLMARFQAFHPDNKMLTPWRKAGIRPLATIPGRFSYSTIDPSFAIYGWQVAIDRKALEFSALKVSDAHHFEVVGSGKATVLTPVLAKPGQRVRVAFAKGAKRSVTKTLSADENGRISIAVDLGPSNAIQQYANQSNLPAKVQDQAGIPFRLAPDGSRFSRVDVTVTAP